MGHGWTRIRRINTDVFYIKFIRENPLNPRPSASYFLCFNHLQIGSRRAFDFQNQIRAVAFSGRLETGAKVSV